MATSTPNYGLKKFESGDPPDLPSLAASMDKIDTELKKNATNIGLLQSRDSIGDFKAWAEAQNSNRTFITVSGTTGIPEGFSFATGILTIRTPTQRRVLLIAANGQMATGAQDGSLWVWRVHYGTSVTV